MDRLHLAARGGQLFSEYRDDSGLSSLGLGEVARAGRIEPVPGERASPRFQVELSAELSRVLGLPAIVLVDEDDRPFVSRASAEAYERRCVESYITRLAQPE